MVNHFKAILTAFLLLLTSSAGVFELETFGSLIHPGPLSKSHAKYEGINNCTECHTLGSGVPDNKCLDCHEKLKKKIDDGIGPHAKYTDVCIYCHSDHKGRNYKMTVIDEELYDHGITGYPLKGKHKGLSCRSCHTIKQVYTGLNRACLSCHEDTHKGDVGRLCERCHTTGGWGEIKEFDHKAETKFEISGKHFEISCKECHVGARFKGLKASKGCAGPDCHNSPHRGKTSDICTKCHNTVRWSDLKPFDHDKKTDFKITGEHAELKCGDCHRDGRIKPLQMRTCAAADCHFSLLWKSKRKEVIEVDNIKDLFEFKTEGGKKVVTLKKKEKKVATSESSIVATSLKKAKVALERGRYWEAQEAYKGILSSNESGWIVLTREDLINVYTNLAAAYEGTHEEGRAFFYKEKARVLREKRE